MSDVAIRVGGRRYSGWLSARIARGLETLCGSFELEVSDRWAGQAVAWPIVEGSSVEVLVDDEVLIDGTVDRRSMSLTAGERRIAVYGRDAASVLVDCSVPLGNLQFRDAAPFDIVRKMADLYGIGVKLAPGVTLPGTMKRWAIGPGETPWQVIERLARAAGVLAVSDGAGGILLTRAGSARADAIVEGDNLLEASADFSVMERFARYVVATQIAGTDNASGAATRVRAEAFDDGAPAGRLLVLRPAAGVSADYARQFADWEARVRAARGDVVRASVVGWRQPSGELWAPNELCSISAPSIGVDGEMLISSVELSLGAGGEVARLVLVRPDAYTPEPKAAKVRKGGRGTRWKELAGGV